jgi:hypothetical protein
VAASVLDQTGEVDPAATDATIEDVAPTADPTDGGTADEDDEES